MKTLQQVEPRTPITNTTAVTVSASGSYYLTANISVTNGTAITITANGVTLDLGGFTVSSTAPGTSGNGISLAAGLSDIAILNGHITGGVTYSGGIYSGSGFSEGINYTSQEPSNVRVSGVSVAGCSNSGIHLGTNTSTVVDSCTVNTAGGVGIAASTVTHSTAYQCGNVAIEANVASDCYGYSTGGAGLVASFTANNCYGLTTYNADGLVANNANNCYGVCGGNGIGLNAIIANNCYGQTSSDIGLQANSANNCTGVSNNGGWGLFAYLTAVGCNGQCTAGGGIGLEASWIGIGCVGFAPTGLGLSAYIANSCAGNGSNNYIATYKYNMP
jgi:hypothetical protein